LGAPKAEARAQQARLGGLEDKAHELAPGRGALALLDEGESGWLGVTIAEITSQKAKELKLPAERGVLLTEVEADSPAAKAGLKPNDVITEFNGQRVEGTVQFRRLVRETPPDRTVQLTLWRDGRAQNVSVQLGRRRERIEKRFRVFPPHDFDFDFDIQIPEIIGGYFGWGAPLLGVSVEDLTGQLGAYFGVPDGEGVLIREVKPGSPAEKAGLKPGDVIIKLDAQRVKTASELRAKLREKREQKSVSLAVIRKGVEMSLNVEIEPAKRGQPGEHRRITRRVLL
jgi:serine protease Do